MSDSPSSSSDKPIRIDAPHSGSGSGEDGEEDDRLNITIKTLDGQSFKIDIEKKCPVSLLKENLATVSGLDVSQQRLIFMGRVLVDGKTIGDSKVVNGSTIHLVPRPKEPVAPSTEPSAPSTQPRVPEDPHPRARVRTSNGLMMGTFSLPDGEDASFQSVLSSVFSSLGPLLGVPTPLVRGDASREEQSQTSPPSAPPAPPSQRTTTASGETTSTASARPPAAARTRDPTQQMGPSRSETSDYDRAHEKEEIDEVVDDGYGEEMDDDHMDEEVDDDHMDEEMEENEGEEVTDQETMNHLKSVVSLMQRILSSRRRISHGSYRILRNLGRAIVDEANAHLRVKSGELGDSDTTDDQQDDGFGDIWFGDGPTGPPIRGRGGGRGRGRGRRGGRGGLGPRAHVSGTFWGRGHAGGRFPFHRHDQMYHGTEGGMDGSRRRRCGPSFRISTPHRHGAHEHIRRMPCGDCGPHRSGSSGGGMEEAMSPIIQQALQWLQNVPCSSSHPLLGTAAEILRGLARENLPLVQGSGLNESFFATLADDVFRRFVIEYVGHFPSDEGKRAFCEQLVDQFRHEVLDMENISQMMDGLCTVASCEELKTRLERRLRGGSWMLLESMLKNEDDENSASDPSPTTAYDILLNTARSLANEMYSLPGVDRIVVDSLVSAAWMRLFALNGVPHFLGSILLPKLMSVCREEPTMEIPMMDSARKEGEAMDMDVDGHGDIVRRRSPTLYDDSNDDSKQPVATQTHPHRMEQTRSGSYKDEDIPEPPIHRQSTPTHDSPTQDDDVDEKKEEEEEEKKEADETPGEILDRYLSPGEQELWAARIGRDLRRQEDSVPEPSDAYTQRFGSKRE